MPSRSVALKGSSKRERHALRRHYRADRWPEYRKPVTVTADEDGRFAFRDVKAGTRVRVTAFVEGLRLLSVGRSSRVRSKPSISRNRLRRYRRTAWITWWHQTVPLARSLVRAFV